LTTSVIRARQRTDNERARSQLKLPNVVGDDGRVSLLLDDRITLLEPCPASMGAVQSRGRRNATDAHLLDVFARAIGRSGLPAVGAPNCTGRPVALAFAREGADVLIRYLGSEEVDADETVR
jgi:hypothetical protein